MLHYKPIFFTHKKWSKSYLLHYVPTIFMHDCNWTRTQNHLVLKRTLNHLAKLAFNDWAVFWVLICTVHLTVCSCYVTYAFQSESTLYSCLNVTELHARRTCEIRRLSDCNWTRSQNHLVHKLTLNHLSKPIKCNYRAWIHCETHTWHGKNIQFISLVALLLIWYGFSYKISYKEHLSKKL